MSQIYTDTEIMEDTQQNTSASCDDGLCPTPWAENPAYFDHHFQARPTPFPTSPVHVRSSTRHAFTAPGSDTRELLGRLAGGPLPVGAVFHHTPQPTAQQPAHP